MNVTPMNSSAQVYDREFRVRGLREQGWGRGLMAVAVLIWLWLGYLLAFPFSVEGHGGGTVECESRAFHDGYLREGDRCDGARDWGPITAGLLVSLPFAIGGAALFASGTATVRTAAYATEIARLNLAE
ncbi:hypothetical protein ACGFXC_00170 [Streptomyces sp. NPDC048507]|uniref:hypothetical protein n=1 Tax=Streptomyces sp. NPDC048507 TaxID=3365560 RepID=UPI00371F0E60